MRTDFLNKTQNNHIRFVLEGAVYYEHYLNLIRNAAKSIHLQTYIFADDAFGRAVQTELKEAAERGVKVYLLIDSVGSISFPEIAEKELIAAGVHFCRFNNVQFRWLGQWGRRLHHKILLIDHTMAMIGGVNVISSSYGNSGIPDQLDFAVYVEGPITIGLTQYCQILYAKSCSRRTKFKKDTSVRKSDPDGVELKISINDWIFQRWQITRQYSELTKNAKKEIIILNSYFFPRRKFMKQLATAAKQGVRVRLILPKISDWPSYVFATQYLYSYFLKNGVEIYQWKDSIMHGKMATIDGRWSTIGSFNLNYTSYQQNLEMNVDIYSDKFTEQLNLKLDQLIATGCEKIELGEFIENATLKTRVLRVVWYVLLNLLANFSIGLAFQEERNRTRIYKRMSIAVTLAFLILGIVGLIVPKMPGLPFLFISFLLVYGQIVFNNRNV